MSGSRSFRARLIAGSVLWTLGLLLVVSASLVIFLATHPQPHVTLFTGFVSVPLGASLAVGLSCVAAGALTIWRGWQAVDLLRHRLADVRHGTAPRLSGAYPAEMQPLVDDLNALLAARDERVARAAARAADEAHALKTPLAVLARDADRVAAYDAALAASMHAEIARMARRVDHHLSQSRVVAAGTATGLRSAVAPAVDDLFRALGRLHQERGLRLEHDVASEQAVRCAPEDLDEILGNLLDNACVWARGRVRVSSASRQGRIAVIVDDDGKGVDAALIPQVVQRGGRADERVPGSGLGLAIVRDLVELYDGLLVLERSPLGGLRVTVTLPAA